MNNSFSVVQTLARSGAFSWLGKNSLSVVVCRCLRPGPVQLAPRLIIRQILVAAARTFCPADRHMRSLSIWIAAAKKIANCILHHTLTSSFKFLPAASSISVHFNCPLSCNWRGFTLTKNAIFLALVFINTFVDCCGLYGIRTRVHAYQLDKRSVRRAVITHFEYQHTIYSCWLLSPARSL